MRVTGPTDVKPTNGSRPKPRGFRPTGQGLHDRGLGPPLGIGRGARLAHRDHGSVVKHHAVAFPGLVNYLFKTLLSCFQAISLPQSRPINVLFYRLLAGGLLGQLAM